MKLAAKQGFAGVEEILKKQKVDSWIYSLVDNPGLKIEKGMTKNIKTYFRESIVAKGWPDGIILDPSLNISVLSIGNRVALHAQTGNLARAFYDLLKFQGLYVTNRIEAAVLILPTHDAAKILGSNIAEYERVEREMKFFSRAVSVPLLLLAFE